MEIIVLKNTDYKEKDAIVEGLTQEGPKSFLVRGLKNPKSSNIALANNLVFADVEIEEGKYKYPIIKKSKVLALPYHLDDDVEKYGIASLLGEITLFLLQEDERGAMYDFLKECVIHLDNKDVDPKSIALIYFMRALREAGSSFEVNECMRCGGKKDIVAFSFSEGGFICRNCLSKEDDLSFDLPMMLSIRKAVIAEEIKTIPDLNKDGFIKILKLLRSYTLDYLGVKITSIDLIL